VARGRWEWIRAEAARHLALVGAQYPDQIDALRLASALDIEVVFGGIGGATERIMKVDGRTRIRISDAIVQRGRREFTAAHAIGHAVCGHTIPLERDVETWIAYACASRHAREERECDVFATEFLTPTAWVRPYCSLGKLDLDAVGAIARVFPVSFVMAAMRFVELTALTCAIVYAEDGFVRWSRGSGAFPCRIHPGMRVPGGSIARGYFDRGATSDAPNRLLARSWLRSTAKIGVATEIVEHAIVIPEPGWGGVLSLLWIPDLSRAQRTNVSAKKIVGLQERR
jgi:hypothetical protein